MPDLKTKQLTEYLSTPYENEINNTKKLLIRMSDIYFVCVNVLWVSNLLIQLCNAQHIPN